MKKLLFITLFALLAAGRTAWADDVVYYDPTAELGSQKKTVNATSITGATTSLSTGWYYVSGNVSNSNRITVNGTVNLILTDGCNFTVSKGIRVASDKALNIYAQSVANCGSLTADLSDKNAAIGGNVGSIGDNEGGKGEDAGTITIYGGNIAATGNIGGGDGGMGRIIDTEWEWESGIGGDGGSGSVYIYGGVINVNGNIGGGSGGEGQDTPENAGERGNNGGGTVNLSWTNASDRITATRYFGTVTLVKSFVDLADNAVDNTSVGGKTIKPAGTTYSVVVSDSLPDGLIAAADSSAALANQIVNISYSAPAGYVPVFTVNYTNANGAQQDAVTDNGDGTYSFTMPSADATITAELKKNIATCTVSLPDQTLSAYSSTYHYAMSWDNILYKFEAANSPASNGFSVGEEVRDGETVLTLGTDYQFGSVEVLSGNGDHTGDQCRVKIIGQGDYAGSEWANFSIIGASGSGTWGGLSWSLSDGTLSITGSGAMSAAATRESYPWYQYASYITTITVGNGVTSIADNAFAGTSNESTYGGVTTVSLPNSLTSIGDYAFAYCTGATITLPSGVTSFGITPFNQVGYYDENEGEVKGGVVASLSATGDNSALIGALSSARYTDITLQGLSLHKDGKWNSLCLPFNVSTETISSSVLNGCTLKELDPVGYYDANDVRYLYNENEDKYYNGSTQYQGNISALHQTGLGADGNTFYLYYVGANQIIAGKPYLIKWASGGDIESPTFTHVRIEDTTPVVTSPDGKVKFVGNYAQKSLGTAGDAFVMNRDYGVFSVPASALNAFGAYVQLTDTCISELESGVQGEVRYSLRGTPGPRNISITGHLHDGAYWSTFYSGSDRYTLPAGAAAYTMNSSSKQLFRLGTDGRTIPADNAVVIISDQASITLTASSDNADITDHSGSDKFLKGSDSPVPVSSITGTPYVLGVAGDPATFGFHQYTGASIPANKAYYVQ